MMMPFRFILPYFYIDDDFKHKMHISLLYITGDERSLMRLRALLEIYFHIIT